MRAPLVAALLAAALPAQMTATVNDPDSHGAVGDSLLSLDEVIRVMNTTLSFNSLSAAERAQFRGGPTSVTDTCEIDFNVTPVITVSAPLSPVIGDSITHVDTNFFGLNGRPVIDGTGRAVVFALKTNHAHFHDLVFLNGQIAHTYDTSLHYHPGRRARFVNCLFVGQSQIGLKVEVPAFPPGAILEMDLTDCVLLNVGTAISFVDPAFSSNIDFTSTNLLIQSCQTGIDLDIRGTAGQNKAIFDRTRMIDVDTGLHVARPTGSGSVFDLQLVHGEIAANGTAIDVEGATVGAQLLSLHHMVVRAGPAPGDHALQSRPASARLDLKVGECDVDGNVNLGSGALSQSLRVHNSRFRNGSFTVDARGASGDFQWNVHESAPVTVAAGNTRPLSFVQCELVRSPIQDLSTGSTTLSSCFLASSPTTNVANVAPAPARWIGRASVTPDNPPLGGHVDLAVDLRPDTAASWILGVAERTPITSIAPYRFYFSLVGAVGIPGPFFLRDVLRLPIPTTPSIQGVELYGQPIVFPTNGQTYVPLHLPAGGRFRIR